MPKYIPKHSPCCILNWFLINADPRPHLRLWESASLGKEPGNLHFHGLSRWIPYMLRFENHWQTFFFFFASMRKELPFPHHTLHKLNSNNQIIHRSWISSMCPAPQWPDMACRTNITSKRGWESKEGPLQPSKNVLHHKYFAFQTQHTQVFPLKIALGELPSSSRNQIFFAATPCRLKRVFYI